MDVGARLSEPKSWSLSLPDLPRHLSNFLPPPSAHSCTRFLTPPQRRSKTRPKHRAFSCSFVHGLPWLNRKPCDATTFMSTAVVMSDPMAQQPLAPRPTEGGAGPASTPLVQRPRKITTACAACKLRKTKVQYSFYSMTPFTYSDASALAASPAAPAAPEPVSVATMLPLTSDERSQIGGTSTSLTRQTTSSKVTESYLVALLRPSEPAATTRCLI